MRPIALTGKMRSGKDSAADHLVSKYGYTRFAFGDELKNDFHRRYPEIPREPKPRIGYQNHGQLMRELIGQDVWVDACFDNIRYSRDCPVSGDDNQCAVISDLRQPNEYDRCRDEGFVIVRVTCTDDVRLERARAAGDNFTESDLAHETESYVDGFPVDYEIINDGTVDELYTKIDAMMAEITKEVD